MAVSLVYPKVSCFGTSDFPFGKWRSRVAGAFLAVTFGLRHGKAALLHDVEIVRLDWDAMMLERVFFWKIYENLIQLPSCGIVCRCGNLTADSELWCFLMLKLKGLWWCILGIKGVWMMIVPHVVPFKPSIDVPYIFSSQSEHHQHTIPIHVPN